MNILRLSTLSLTLATAVITLTIVLASLAPRIAGADQNPEGINFVSVLQADGLNCYQDFHAVEGSAPDPKEELGEGMDQAGVRDNVLFRGIMRADKVDLRGLQGCGIELPDDDGGGGDDGPGVP